MGQWKRSFIHKPYGMAPELREEGGAKHLTQRVVFKTREKSGGVVESKGSHQKMGAWLLTAALGSIHICGGGGEYATD